MSRVKQKVSFEGLLQKNVLGTFTVIRGFAVLVQSLALGIRTLNFSFNVAMADGEPKPDAAGTGPAAAPPQEGGWLPVALTMGAVMIGLAISQASARLADGWPNAVASSFRRASVSNNSASHPASPCRTPDRSGAKCRVRRRNGGISSTLFHR